MLSYNGKTRDRWIDSEYTDDQEVNEQCGLGENDLLVWLFDNSEMKCTMSIVRMKKIKS